MNNIRVGVVGIGNMGSAHSLNIYANKVKGAVLGAVCDIDKTKKEWAKQNLGDTEFFESYEDMIKSGKVDAVIIATPHNLHPVIASFAFDMSLHVLSEKPIGTYTKIVRSLNEKAKQSGKVFAIMFNQRVNPVFKKAREIVHSGQIGELVRFVWIITNWYRRQQYYESSSWRATWKGEGGGILANQCVHNLDVMQWITGLPKTIEGHCNYGRFHDIEVEDDVTAYFEYENAATGVFISSTGENPGSNHLEISGTKGKMVLEEGKIKLWKSNVSEREYCYFSNEEYTEKVKFDYEEIEFPGQEFGCAHIAVIQNFINAIQNGEECIAPGYEGINSLRLSNAIHLSDWTKSKVSIDFDEELYQKKFEEKIQTSKTQKRIRTDDSIKMGNSSKRWEVKW